MIPVWRGEPPEELVAIHETLLRKIEKQCLSGHNVRLRHVHVSKEIRAKLGKRQGWKCAYCETPITLSGSDAEHFRPKCRAIRDPEGKSTRDLQGRAARRRNHMPTYGYVWLAAHPINLFITCTGCNRNKGIYFPLDPTGGVLTWGEMPPGAELPLLIDPSREDPSEHIRFAPGGNNWWAVPRNSSPQGTMTIALLELNCSQLRSSYKSHVKHCVDPHVRRIRRKIEANDKAKIETAWRRALRELFAPEAPFQLLSHDVLDQTFSAPERAVFGLSLPKPSAVHSPWRG